jgi:hypothetical protein
MLGWRPGIIYAYSTVDFKTGKRERWSYVGKTRQTLVKRHNQHMDVQPWSDLFPQVRVVFDFRSCPDWWLTWAEKLTIWVMRPLYNYEYNTKNSRRIPKYQAEADRKTRDRLVRMRRMW